jgi:hypothetical protein
LTCFLSGTEAMQSGLQYHRPRIKIDEDLRVKVLQVGHSTYWIVKNLDLQASLQKD